MLTRLHISLLIGLAVVIWAVALLARGVPITAAHAWPFGITVSVLTIVVIVFERWAWKWGVFKGWLVKRPNLQGTWRATLQSSWKKEPTDPPLALIDAVVTIRQTFSAFSFRQFTRESSSFLVAHQIVQQNDGVYEVFGLYQNTPAIHLRGERSEIHFGALLLQVRGDPATKLEGHYWTDRSTRGSMVLTDRRKKLVSDFAEGSALYKIAS